MINLSVLVLGLGLVFGDCAEVNSTNPLTTEKSPKPCPVFNPTLQICCEAIIWPRTLGDSCCGTLPYKATTDECCNNTVVARPPYRCCEKTIYLPTVQQCCHGAPVPLGPPTMNYECCGHFAFNPKTYQCCAGIPQPRGSPAMPFECCDHHFFNPFTQMCCNGTRVLAKMKGGCDDAIRIPFNPIYSSKIHTEGEGTFDGICRSFGG